MATRQRIKSSIVEITSYPRIHASLLSMHDGGPRIFGGLGFSISTPSLTVRFSPHRKVIFDGSAIDHRPKQEIRRVQALLDSFRDTHKLSSGIRVELTNAIPIHSGFGSGTMFTMSCVEAIALLNGRRYLPD